MRSSLPALAVLLATLAACGSSSHSPSGFSAAKGPGATCAATSECRTDLVCAGGTCGTFAAAPSCATPGVAPALHAGTTFDPGDPGPGTCVSTVRAAAFDPADGVSVQDLGEHQVGETVPFTVPANTISLSIVSQEVNGSAQDAIVYQGSSLPNSVVPDQVRTPAGATFYDDVTGTSTDAAYLALSPVSGAFTAPNTTTGIDRVRIQGAMPSGTWSFLSNDFARECPSIPGCTGGSASGRYHHHAVTKAGPVASTGALDVEVYLLIDPTGSSSMIATAVQAAASPLMQRWARSYATFLGRAGLCVGDVTFHDLPAWVLGRYPGGSVDVTKDGPCDPLSQLFTTAVAPKRAVHLVLADELVDTAPSNGGIIVGLDGSIPGPSGFPGTVFGGAAVGLFGELGTGNCSGTGPSLACGTDLLAYVAAHETGHWLGLYHTTEATGGDFDPLSDTPQCRCTQCARSQTSQSSCSAGTYFVSTVDCTASATCGGGSNLMFWSVGQRSTGDLTRDQGQVVRLNPAVR